MLGALIGDYVGSVYEWRNHKHKDFEPFFSPRSFFTDDSVLTVAVADALLNNRSYAHSFKDWGRRYPNSGWGGRFHIWLFSDNTEPYNSFGNGSAMRCSPTGFLAKSLEEALELATASAIPTHDHPEGVKGAQAVAAAIHLARQGMDINNIQSTVMEISGYDLNRNVDEIRVDYRFNETCQGSVPEALICAFEAQDFEDAIRNAISIGGDSDTIAAIAGGIAEARFGIPEHLSAHVWDKMPEDMKQVMRALYQQ